MNQKPEVIIDEEGLKAAKAKEKRVVDLAKDDLRFILATPQGRRFLWRYLEKCGVYSRSAEQSGSWTYFNEGRRSIGLDLINDIVEANPEQFLAMQKEGRNG